MSLPTLNVPRVTYCTDSRCMESRTCWRAEHERYGNAPGENYGPRCIPAPAAQRTYEDGLAEGERRATAAVVAWLRREAKGGEPAMSASAVGWTLVKAEAIERGEHVRAAGRNP